MVPFDLALNTTTVTISGALRRLQVTMETISAVLESSIRASAPPFGSQSKSGHFRARTRPARMPSFSVFQPERLSSMGISSKTCFRIISNWELVVSWGSQNAIVVVIMSNVEMSFGSLPTSAESTCIYSRSSRTVRVRNISRMQNGFISHISARIKLYMRAILFIVRKVLNGIIKAYLCNLIPCTYSCVNFPFGSSAKLPSQHRWLFN